MINRFYFFLASVLIAFSTRGQNGNNLADFGLGKLSHSGKTAVTHGSFITIKGTDDISYNAYGAGPAGASAGILFVHDYFGISEATKES